MSTFSQDGMQGKKVYCSGYSMQQSHDKQKKCKGWVNNGMSLTILL